MAKRVKANIEFLLVKAEIKGVPENVLLKSRNIGQVDLIWPRTGVAKQPRPSALLSMGDQVSTVSGAMGDRWTIKNKAARERAACPNPGKLCGFSCERGKSG